MIITASCAYYLKRPMVQNAKNPTYTRVLYQEAKRRNDGWAFGRV